MSSRLATSRASRAAALAAGLALATVVVVPPAGAGAPAGTEGLTLRAAKARAGAKTVAFTLSTRQAWDAAGLAAENGRLCAEVGPFHGRAPSRSFCVATDPRSGEPALRTHIFASTGRERAVRRTRGRLSFPGAGTVRMAVERGELGLEGDRLRWVASTQWNGAACAQPSGSPPACRDRLPASGATTVKLPPAPTPTCVPRGPAFRARGPAKRAVAIGLDDGPSAYTSAMLRTLKRTGSHATFYVLGQQIAGRQALLRRMIREGHEIGNHSWAHRPGVGLPATSAAIKRATGGWKPCTYRPPYGLQAGSGQARGLGMIDVTWNVDPRDWSLPGSGAIASRVLGSARAGSIVVMHDGGGPRSQSVAALPAIIRGLKRRGLRVVSVQELLGLVPRR